MQNQTLLSAEHSFAESWNDFPLNLYFILFFFYYHVNYLFFLRKDLWIFHSNNSTSPFLNLKRRNWISFDHSLGSISLFGTLASLTVSKSSTPFRVNENYFNCFQFLFGCTPFNLLFLALEKQKKVILGFLILKRKHFETFQPSLA